MIGAVIREFNPKGTHLRLSDRRGRKYRGHLPSRMRGVTASPVQTTRIRLDSLTGVRAFAALMVFGYHAIHYLPGGELAFFGAGMTGVSLFYILSGFVLAWVYRPSDNPGLFYRRRFARIYPAYIVAVLIAIAVAVATRGFSTVDLAAFTLLQSWWPNPAVYYAASPVFWSLSCEAFFYLVFPLVSGHFARASARVLWMLT